MPNAISVTSNKFLIGYYKASANTTDSTNFQVWTSWNRNQFTLTQSVATAGTVITNQQVWQLWSDTYIVTQSVSGSITQTDRLRQATPEQVRAQRETQLRIEVERSQANDRAEKLLRENLTPGQREELSAKGFFTLRTIRPSGEERTYRIRRGRSRNVEQVDASGRRLKTLCAHPVALVPDADTMLSQKLMLESGEDDFLQIANHS